MSSSDGAGSLPQFPECGLKCLVEAIAAHSNCSAADFQCVCPNQAVQAAGGACILESCTVKEALAAQAVSNALCHVLPNDEGYFVGFLIAFLAISTVLVSLRFAARYQKGIGIWWDDWTILGSVLTCIGWTTICIMFRGYGAGRDVWAVPYDNIEPLLRLFYISFFFYAVSRCLVRVSIILFLIRLFEVYDAKPFLIGALVFNISLSVSFVGALIFQCSPIHYFWQRWDGLHQGQCIDQWALLLSAGVLAIVFDVFIMLIPLRWMIQLQLTLVKKIATTVMLSLGVVVVAVSVERIIALRKFVEDSNITANFPLVVVWGGLDIHVAIICACLPSLRLMVMVLGTRVKLWGSSANSKGTSPSNQPSSQESKKSGWRGPSYANSESSQTITLVTTIQQQRVPASSESQRGIATPSFELHDYHGNK